MPKAWLVIAGAPRKELDLEEGSTVKDALAAAKVTRHKGEFLIIGTQEVADDYVVKEGESLVFVPPVGLG